MRVILSAMLAVVLGLVAAGCGGSTPAAQRTRTVTVRSGTPATTSGTTTPPGTTASTATTTPAAAGAGACTATDLAPSFGGSNGATGNIVLYVSLKNTGSSRCHTYGYPGVEFLDQTGAALPTAAKRTTHDILGEMTPVLISLAPGEIASFRLVVPQQPPSAIPCHTAFGLQVIAPDDTARMSVKIPDGISECQQATVSPLKAGSAAPPGT